MQENKRMQNWMVWYPQAAATGLLLARGFIDETDILLLHSAAPVITVEVTDQNGVRLAVGEDLPKTIDSPICRLQKTGLLITRQDIWPTEADLGSMVMLPGGEVGKLISWWNANDLLEWRWQIELYNSIR